MTRVEQLGAFTARASYEQLSPQAVSRLKVCVLDALGCALGALSAQLRGNKSLWGRVLTYKD